MKKLSVFGMLFIVFSCKIYCQSQSVFFELGGPGLASFNFDTRFTDSNKGIGGRIGFGINGLSNGTKLLIPVGINYLLSENDKNFFEIGAGLTVANNYSEGNFSNTFGHVSIGYRFHPKEGGFLFRAAIVPIFGKDFFWPFYAGVSFGYQF